MVAAGQLRHDRVIIQHMPTHMAIVERRTKMFVCWRVENHYPTGAG